MVWVCKVWVLVPRPWFKAQVATTEAYVCPVLAARRLSFLAAALPRVRCVGFKAPSRANCPPHLPSIGVGHNRTDLSRRRGRPCAQWAVVRTSLAVVACVGPDQRQTHQPGRKSWMYRPTVVLMPRPDAASPHKKIRGLGHTKVCALTQVKVHASAAHMIAAAERFLNAKGFTHWGPLVYQRAC